MTTIKIKEFEEYCQEQLGLSKHSLRAYRQDLSAFAKFRAKVGLAEQPSGCDVIAFQKDLREEQRASPSTIRRRLVTLRSYYKWREAVCPGERSPFEGLRLDLKIPKRLPRPVDRPTLSALFQSAEHIIHLDPEAGLQGPREVSARKVTGLIARLLVVTGLRISELTELRVQDVTGAATRIRVRGKGDRERTVYVANDRLQKDFRHYWQGKFDTQGSQAWLFANTNGERLTAQAYRKRLRTLSRSLRIEPHLTPHRFRHSAATLLIEEGVDIRLVQRLLGHASIATTEIYTKVSDNSLSSAVVAADTLATVDA
ncbi:putative tyrosine recombinase XerC (plasmid) [Phaeobacter inhibens]|uniref:Tyrosine recombinase XerC n=1 Tax=Phaeobacter inhibens TaxID=221822 RepID=A0ABM6RKC6_9RHOB|nr:tyrosine-type recombinase/integrase [Phaeobacter inhibens]AUQ52408.1 putative tyrosine recombinase XerC [Phaeobacter inhibens]AUQ97013.1 putative tyrosine recombinase XerC [Phaeobacter inhibens]AUR22213.1 putative tyrosine recombinase XerC [Phaeobacter inhibens]